MFLKVSLFKNLIICFLLELVKILFGVFILIILFWFINIIWFVIFLVKFILCVIIIMCIFSFIKDFIVSNIFLIIFGLSVEVGLLNKMILGFI